MAFYHEIDVEGKLFCLLVWPGSTNNTNILVSPALTGPEYPGPLLGYNVPALSQWAAALPGTEESDLAISADSGEEPAAS